ncbi:ABC transporter ATP-binding protein [Chelativorans sp. AA-79]|uniref:ATP-binding cassette domain-containing protein n=1 Tax=Chelativorans sp. AA-79 TaxID=3028735 RepID=UPI0023F6AF8D|nr:ABC transporter ATP-binding protein [Chelativorans sp. AA-79]WEX10453.1 ABC transporter ATP-binding protein [Chelativorans sp. AA-79]
MTAPLATLRKLSVSYRAGGAAHAALSSVDLDLFQGERLAIIGESGSGKSTLALALAGLLPENAVRTGVVDWPGLGREPVPGRDIGFVFQDASASLNPVLTVGEQVAEVVRRHTGAGWPEALKEAERLLARVRIPQPEKAVRSYPHQFSGGQRQRIAIAAAIAARPRLLVADEPTSALDTIVQAEIVGLLDGLVREADMTLVFITHDIALASGFADRIAVFHEARLVEAGPTRSLLAGPREPYTRRLLESSIDLATPPLVSP